MWAKFDSTKRMGGTPEQCAWAFKRYRAAVAQASMVALADRTQRDTRKVSDRAA